MRRLPWLIAGVLTAGIVGTSLVALQSDDAPAQPKAALQVGTYIAPGRIHWINSPGRYGLGNVPAGDQYAVVSGELVRIDADTGILRAVLRPMTRLLD